MIILHPKICRQKSSNKYIPLNYSNNIDVVVIDFYIIGQLFFSQLKRNERHCTDLIVFDPISDMK